MRQNTQTIITDKSPDDVNELDSFRRIQDENQHLSDKLEAERDQHLRLAAEYKNFRRRTEQENANAADNGKRELLIQLISVADDLDLALAASNESHGAVAEGQRVIHRRFHDILEKNGVNAFESKGTKFDPERHEAFDVVSAGDGESGTVYQEMRRGYFWNGKLLRPALVVVKQ